MTPRKTQNILFCRIDPVKCINPATRTEQAISSTTLDAMIEQPQHPQQPHLWVFELFHLGGVPISIHYSMLILLIMQVFAATLSFHDNLYSAFVFIVFGPTLFTTVFIHELGHALATRCSGGIVDRIVLWPLGGFTIYGSSEGSVADDLWIALSGPLTHVVQGGLWIGLYSILKHGDFSSFSTWIQREDLETVLGYVSAISSQAVLVNIVVFIFNVAVPAYPLDGGRSLVALLTMGGCKFATTARITSVTGTITGLLMLFIGVYWYALYTTAGSLFMIFVARYVINSGSRLWAAAAASRLYQHPLFELNCYRNRGRRRGVHDSGTTIEQSRSSRNVVDINV